MLTKSLNSFSSHWLVWGLVAALAVLVPLLNAWFGLPLPITLNALYNAIGGIIPYSDAGDYLYGGQHFIDVGFLDSWNMRRPINALFLAFRLKIANGNFWYVIAIQAGFCMVALTLYLRTLRQDIGLLATSISLLFCCAYIQTFIHTTLSEALGLTLGFLSFVLIWNGYLQKNRFSFNAGMASLAVALCARAGPNFMVPALFLLVYLDPFTHSRFKDLLGCAVSFTIPFIFISKLSTLYGDPASSGMAFANFGSTLYGLVSGGNTWIYAYQDPHIQSLVIGKNEAQLTKILYEESWKVFKANPFNIVVGMIHYLGGFLYFFISKLTFGTGIIFILTNILSTLFWLFILFKIYAKRHLLKREFLFLLIVFTGIAISSCIVWKDGGIRVFAVAIPFIGALFGFSFASSPMLIHRKFPETILAVCMASFIVLGAVLTPYIPSRMERPDISALKANNIPGQETFLTYNLNKQPHLLIDDSPGFHFRTISPNQIDRFSRVYSDSPVSDELRTMSRYNNPKIVLLFLYDYISHSNKLVIAENDILNLNSEWLEIHAASTSNDFKIIYKANSFTGLPQK